MECSDLDENVKMLFCTVNKWPENYKDSFKKYYYGLQSFLRRRVCTNYESSQAPVSQERVISQGPFSPLEEQWMLLLSVPPCGICLCIFMYIGFRHLISEDMSRSFSN